MLARMAMMRPLLRGRPLGCGRAMAAGRPSAPPAQLRPACARATPTPRSFDDRSARFLTTHAPAGDAAVAAAAEDAAEDAKIARMTDALVAGNRLALSRAITLVESASPRHYGLAQKLLADALRKVNAPAERVGAGAGTGGHAHKCIRLGIAGPPGAGKSTFIEALGLYLIRQLGLRVAVLAVDPSSQRTGGSILGDKTRMTELSKDDSAFVRPSPTQGNLGGIALHTNDVVLLCEAARYDVVVVETVGVGQSEVEVDSAVDAMMLLVPPTGGDELQGVKKGIIEMVDLLVVNKNDGELKQACRHTAAEYKRGLQLRSPKVPGWKPPVLRCSALHQEAIKEVWDAVGEFYDFVVASGELLRKREEQNTQWMWTHIRDKLYKRIQADPDARRVADDMRRLLTLKATTPREAAAKVLEAVMGPEQ